ncbi:MAG: ELM1/GtrOC1 family putative glycosyltransferase, partial [Candidatus Theseobacter exili]|nr:ELM1/GtrOC1 family putative glycosyltransferase [Candidatus Theseobacter exili]
GFSPEQFDLAILPLHDKVKVKNSNHLLTILGAPNRIFPKFLEENALKLRESNRISSKRIIGFLVGGNSGHSELLADELQKAVLALKNYAESTESSILVTTSRRTPDYVEQMLKEELDGWERCELLVFASSSNDNPVPGILGLAELILVTEDSFSMVSEAASTGKKTVVLRVNRRPGKRLKYEEILNIMQTRQHIKRTNPKDLAQLLSEIEHSDEPFVELDDTRKAVERVKQLLCEEASEEEEKNGL